MQDSTLLRTEREQSAVVQEHAPLIENFRHHCTMGASGFSGSFAPLCGDAFNLFQINDMLNIGISYTIFIYNVTVFNEYRLQ